MSQILKNPYTAPSAWTREDMERDARWRYTLHPDEVAELRSAVQSAAATGLPLEKIDKQHFPLKLLARRIDALAIVAAMKAEDALSAVPTIGFSQHTQTEAIVAAREAGVSQVMARSAFFERLPELLSAAA